MPRRAKVRSAFWRLTPIIALTAVVVLLGGGIAMALFLDHSYRDQKLGEVSVQAGILASTVTAALAFTDQQAGQEYVNALAVNPEVVAAAVYDASGARFVSFLRRDDEIVPDTAPSYSTHFEGDQLIVVAPVVEAGAPLGL